MGQISEIWELLLCEYWRKIMIIGERNTDLKRLTGRLKLRFLTEIGQFHWNQGEEVAHFAWFGEPCRTYPECAQKKKSSALFKVLYNQYTNIGCLIANTTGAWNRFRRGHVAYIPYILTRDVMTNVAKPLPVLFQAWKKYLKITHSNNLCCHSLA
jgi:hypothetical protein